MRDLSIKAMIIRRRKSWDRMKKIAEVSEMRKGETGREGTFLQKNWEDPAGYGKRSAGNAKDRKFPDDIP